jgi:hypothetical protein
MANPLCGLAPFPFGVETVNTPLYMHMRFTRTLKNTGY